MNATEIAASVIRRVTGNAVCNEMQSTEVEALVLDSFREVTPWYDEPDHVATVTIAKTAERAGYIDVAMWNPEVKYVRRVAPIRLESDYTGDIVRDLLLLPASPIDTQAILEQAQWEMTWPMVKNMLGRDSRFRFEKSQNKIYLDDYLESAVTVYYIPLPAGVDEITYQKALNWVIDYTEALFKLALGRVRAKFRSGAIRFETDGTDLISEGQEEKRQLREDLKDLYFRPIVK
jgi:hypothetical protein